MTARLINSPNNSSCGNRGTKTQQTEKKFKLNVATLNVGGTTSLASNAINVTSTSGRSTDSRRANKPLMEKRRRARINQSLTVLKTLILDSAKLENTKHSKLEKADILELTVRHLQRQRILSSTVVSKYRAGFQECTREVSRFLETELVTSNGQSSPPSLDPQIKQRLLHHLDNCIAELDLDFGLASSSSNSSTPQSGDNKTSEETHLTIKTENEELPDISNSCEDENNNGTLGGTPEKCNKDSPSGTPELELEVSSPRTVAVSGASTNSLLSVVQVIPSRLPDGQVVFLLPSHYIQLAAAAAAAQQEQLSQQEQNLPNSCISEVWTETTLDSSINFIQNDSQSGSNFTEYGFENSSTNSDNYETENSKTICDQPIDFTINKRGISDENKLTKNVRHNDSVILFQDKCTSNSPMIKSEGLVWRPW